MEENAAYVLPSLPSLPAVGMAGPYPWCNWVIGRQVLAGAFPATLDDAETKEILRSLLELGICTFVCLQSEFRLDEPERNWRAGNGLRPYIKDATALLSSNRKEGENRITQTKLDFLHLPIIDGSITTDAAMERLVEDVRQRVLRGEHIYVHCWGGHGRTGTLVALLLSSLYGLHAREALDYTQALHDARGNPQGVRSPQTRIQREQVRRIISFQAQQSVMAGPSNGPEGGRQLQSSSLNSSSTWLESKRSFQGQTSTLGSRDGPAGRAQRPSSARTSPGAPQKQTSQASRAAAQSGLLTSPDAQQWHAQKLPPGPGLVYNEAEHSTSGSDLIKAGHVGAVPQSSQLPNGPQRPMSGGQSFFREASRSSSIVGGGKQRLRLPQMDSIEAAPERPQALGESSAEAGFLPALLQSASLAPAASSDHRQRPSTALLTRLGSAPRGLQLADGMAPLLRTNSRTGAGNLRPADSLTQPATPFPLEDSASTVRHPCQLQSTTPFADGYAGRPSSAASAAASAAASLRRLPSNSKQKPWIPVASSGSIGRQPDGAPAAPLPLLHSGASLAQGTNARPGSGRLITPRTSIDRGSTNLTLQKSFSAATRLSNSGGSGLLSARLSGQQSQTPRSSPDGRLQKAVLPGLPALNPLSVVGSKLRDGVANSSQQSYRSSAKGRQQL